MSLDPLVMPSLERVLRANRKVAAGEASILLPDYVTKEGLSGASYWIELPGEGADAPWKAGAN